MAAAGAAAWQAPAAVLAQYSENFEDKSKGDMQALTNLYNTSTVVYAPGMWDELLSWRAEQLQNFDFAMDVQEIEPLMKICMKENYGLLTHGTKIVVSQLPLSALDFDGMQSLFVRYDQPHQHYLRPLYDKSVLSLAAKRCFALRHATVC